jgi:Mg-chelatase subunit ChlI
MSEAGDKAAQALYELAKRIVNYYEWRDNVSVNDALISELENVVIHYEVAHPGAEDAYHARRAKEIRNADAGRS